MKIRRQLWWRKEKSRGQDELVAWLESQMILPRIIHIYWVFLFTSFESMRLYGQNAAFRSSTSRKFYSSISSAFCSVLASKTPVTNTYVPFVESGEDNPWIQLTRILIKGPVPTPYTIVQHPFLLTFSKRRMVNTLLFVSCAWDYSYSFSFHMTTFALFLSYENPTTCSFYRILITDLHHCKYMKII